MQIALIWGRTHVCAPSRFTHARTIVTLVGNCLGVRAKRIYGQLVQKAGPCEVAIETVKLSRAAPTM